MASAPTSMTVGDRTFIPTSNDFGNVLRPSFLGLQDAPVILMDDGTRIGFAGINALQQVYTASTGKNLSNQAVTVPLDVRIVGILQMNSRNIAPPVQAIMFAAFRALSVSDRDALVNRWTAANAGTQADQDNFINAMVAQLDPPPPPAP